jgi:uncharacterized membrane protein YsdA (DUF1294 family)
VWVLVVYLISSGCTYGLYVLDKANAVQGLWRVPEVTLHLFELACGWPGALIGQEYQRHKTTKASYQGVFWMVVGINLVVLLGYLGYQLLAGH